MADEQQEHDDESWTERTMLGAGSPFHADPAVGGPPLVSTDGRWVWHDDHWEPHPTSPA